MKEYKSKVVVYKEPFEVVMAAYDLRFPSCAELPQVRHCQQLSHKTCDDGTKTEITRRCEAAVDCPEWLQKKVGLESGFFGIQVNSIDRTARTLDIKMWNESLPKKLSVREHCRYYVHPDNPEWTCFTQHTSLEVKVLWGLNQAIEAVAVRNYEPALEKGRTMIQHFVRLNRETHNITAESLRPFSATTPHALGSGLEDGPITRKLMVRLADEEVRTGGEAHYSGVEAPGEEEEPEVEAPEEDVATCFATATSGMEEEIGVRVERMREELQRQLTAEQLEAHSDRDLRRFLIASKGSEEKACGMLLQSLAWRERERVDTIFERDFSERLRFGECQWGGFDVEGRPTLVLNASAHAEALKASTNEPEATLQLMVYMMEQGMRDFSPIDQVTVWIDLSHCSFSDIDVSGVRKALEVIMDNYPERLAHCIIYPASTLFWAIWKMISVLLDKRTTDKIHFVREGKRQKLNSFLPPDHPVFFKDEILEGEVLSEEEALKAACLAEKPESVEEEEA